MALTPALPPLLPPGTAVIHVVRTEFVAVGDVSDFDEDKKAQIQNVVAEAANVSPFVVSVRVLPASVRVLAEITFDDAATATATASALSGTPSTAAPGVQPIFADLVSINAAFASARVSVVSISAPPRVEVVAAPSPPSPAFPSLSPRVGAVSDGKKDDSVSPGIVVGSLVFFQLLMFAAWYYYRTRSRAGKPITVTSVHMAASHANVPYDIPQASAASSTTETPEGLEAAEDQDAKKEMGLINELAASRAEAPAPAMEASAPAAGIGVPYRC